MNKVFYVGLSNIEYRYIKLIEIKEQTERALYGPNGFFATAPRKENGNVDFEKLNDKVLDNFESWDKDLKEINKKIERIINKYGLKEIEIKEKHNLTKNKGYGGNF
jgi:hypothetical protein